MYKSFKYRLYPDEEQKILLEKHFGCTRFVYNYFLELKQKQYNESGTSVMIETIMLLLIYSMKE